MSTDYKTVQRNIAKLKELSNRFIACNDEELPGMVSLGETLDEIAVSIEDAVDSTGDECPSEEYTRVIDQAINAANCI